MSCHDSEAVALDPDLESLNGDITNASMIFIA
jgi:hypothetical protein